MKKQKVIPEPTYTCLTAALVPDASIRVARPGGSVTNWPEWCVYLDDMRLTIYMSREQVQALGDAIADEASASAVAEAEASEHTDMLPPGPMLEQVEYALKAAHRGECEFLSGECDACCVVYTTLTLMRDYLRAQADTVTLPRSLVEEIAKSGWVAYFESAHGEALICAGCNADTNPTVILGEYKAKHTPECWVTRLRAALKAQVAG